MSDEAQYSKPHSNGEIDVGISPESMEILNDNGIVRVELMFQDRPKLVIRLVLQKPIPERP